MKDPTRWVISPTDGQTHSLLPASDHVPAVPVTRCGQLLPMGIPQHKQLPGWQLCVSCLWYYLTPIRMLPPESPASHRSNPDSSPPRGVPDGEPVPADDAEISSPGCPMPSLPRWVPCPLDQHMNLLSPEELAAPGGENRGRAGCWRGIPAAALRLVRSTAWTCPGWIVVASGTAR